MKARFVTGLFRYLTLEAIVYAGMLRERNDPDDVMRLYERGMRMATVRNIADVRLIAAAGPDEDVTPLLTSPGIKEMISTTDAGVAVGEIVQTALGDIDALADGNDDYNIDEDALDADLEALEAEAATFQPTTPFETWLVGQNAAPSQ
jgi:hypothetical protein